MTVAKFSALKSCSSCNVIIYIQTGIPWNLSFRYTLFPEKKKTPNNAVTPQSWLNFLSPFSFRDLCLTKKKIKTLFFLQCFIYLTNCSFYDLKTGTIKFCDVTALFILLISFSWETNVLGIIISLVYQLVAMVTYTEKHQVSLTMAKWQQESTALSCCYLGIALVSRISLNQCWCICLWMIAFVF